MEKEKQQGQSAVLVAFLLLALVIFAAIAVDLSSAYFWGRTAQNASDAAALAGAGELARQRNLYGKQFDNKSDAWLVKAEMNDLAERNGIEDTDPRAKINDNVLGYYLGLDGSRLTDTPFPVSTNPNKRETIPSDAYGIEAVTYVTAPTFLGGVVGFNGYPQDREAAVWINAPVCGVTCTVPVATYWCDPDKDPDCEMRFEESDPPIWAEGPWTTTVPFQCYNIWNGTGPGNYGWLNWTEQDMYCDTNDCGEECLVDNLAPAGCAPVEIGDLVAGGPGTVTSQGVRDQLDQYIGFPYNSDDPPLPFVVPLFTTTIEGQGCNQAYIVSGFAVMQLLGYELSQGGGSVTYDPWVDPLLCTNMPPPGVEPVVPEPGELPNYGRRLTAFFMGLIDPSSLSGECDPSGTLSTIRLTK
jgi:hypothetical protein